ncbi:YjiH family protein [Rothia uropygialis]|uniref:YjiH family protein n=1 Tax=Kocuria sp. 36 TaxID=1415402 RepID=UPI001EE8777D|nr:YjiH family protein [Kocuria sp. 36]
MTEKSRAETQTAAMVPVGTPGAWKDTAKLIVFSLIGIVVFFVPITMNGKSSIPLDHLVTLVREYAGPVVPWLMLALILVGSARPFVTGSWNQTPTKIVFSILNVVGLLAAILMVSEPPAWLADPDIGPFLWKTLVQSVGLIVPIGAIFLGFLIGFGLMEFVGVFVRPIMRPIWRTPGRSAVDAVASFVGSYSLGLLITNRVYKAGGYTTREAAIVAVGFSTVSVTFMVVVANALDLMDYWLMYFFVSLVVTFLVTAITVRIPPLSRVPDKYYPGSTPTPEETVTHNRFGVAWSQALGTLRSTPGVFRVIWANFKDGVMMASSILPSIMSVGLIGLLLAKHTPIFDWLAWIFYPVTWLVRLPEPLMAGKAVGLGLVEMFLPSAEISPDQSLILRFVIAVVSVSGIIFLSAMVPSILATEIPLKFWALIVIWFERVVLSLLITTPIAYLLL